MTSKRFEIQWLNPPSAEPIRIPPSKSIKIGRDTSNHLHLPHHAVSRHHATFEPAGGGWRLVDNGSTNGVTVNDKKQKNVLLAPGDVIRIGSYVFRFAESDALSVREFSFELEHRAITVGLGRDVGKQRDLPNEDHAGAFADLDVTTEQLANKGYLFVVSDGMGGHSGGKLPAISW